MSEKDLSVCEHKNCSTDSGQQLEELVTEDKDWNYVSKTSIDDLNEYSLIEILSYFSLKDRIKLSRVCHKWKDCIQKSFNTEKVFNSKTFGVDRPVSDEDVSEKAVCLLIQKCCNVRHISFNGLFLFKSCLTKTKEEEKSTDNIVVTIASNCLRLESIDFGEFDGFDEYFERNANYFKRLKKIVSQNIDEKSLNLIIDSQNL